MYFKTQINRTIKHSALCELYCVVTIVTVYLIVDLQQLYYQVFCGSTDRCPQLRPTGYISPAFRSYLYAKITTRSHFKLTRTRHTSIIQLAHLTASINSTHRLTQSFSIKTLGSIALKFRHNFPKVITRIPCRTRLEVTLIISSVM